MSREEQWGFEVYTLYTSEICCLLTPAATPLTQMLECHTSTPIILMMIE